MSNNTVYVLANVLALSGWILLFLSAFTSLKFRWLAGRAVPVILALFYTVLMISLLPFEGGGFDTLENLSRLYAQPEVALVGWIHYLAFDLFIGGWQVETAKREQLPTLVLFPSMLLTLFFGPAGLVVFLVARYLHNSKDVEVRQPQAYK